MGGVIAFLRGRVANVEADGVVVDVGGVGYSVRVPASLLADLGPEGATVTLHTYLHVRENEVVLYGAGDADSIALFGDLLTVSGVGPKLALAMLSTHDAPSLARIVVSEDVARLSQVPGIGTKTARRLVLELKGRFEAAGLGAVVAPGAVDATDTDALAALVALGYSRAEARHALAVSGAAADATVEQRILAALRAMAG